MAYGYQHSNALQRYAAGLGGGLLGQQQRAMTAQEAYSQAESARIQYMVAQEKDAWRRAFDTGEPKARKKNIKEELQDEVDEWLKDVL